MLPILIYFYLFFSSDARSADISWEKNVQVKQVPITTANEINSIPACVNINAADKQQLLSLKGIGPKKADAIIQYRSTKGAFKKVEELAKIKGFSQKILTNIIKKNEIAITVNNHP